MSALALHGGRIREAARRFGRDPETFVDFSSNMNVLAPSVSEEDWARWRADIPCYPEDDDLRERLAEIYEIAANRILPTAGAIEGIYLAARLFEGKRVAIFGPCFSEYSRAFKAAGARVEHKLLSTIFEEDFSAFDALVVCNPNNPTGDFFSAQKLLALKTPGLIVDEAFIEFADDTQSLLTALNTRPDILVFRSLTKSWRIPGLRLGFLATANSESLARLHAMQPPWSINSITAAWARSHLTRERYLHVREGLRRLSHLRQIFRERLTPISGIEVHPSAANFFLIELKAAHLDASLLFDALARRGFLVRIGDSFEGLAPGRFIRVAVRTGKENELFADTLECVVEELLRSDSGRCVLEHQCHSDHQVLSSGSEAGRLAEAPLLQR